MLRIHADGSSTGVRRRLDPHAGPPARLDRRRLWLERRAGGSSSGSSSRTGARDLGMVERSDLTGFNWADVPVVLVETGFMSNPREGGLLRTAAYQRRVGGALAPQPPH